MKKINYHARRASQNCIRKFHRAQWNRVFNMEHAFREEIGFCHWSGVFNKSRERLLNLHYSEEAVFTFFSYTISI